MFRKEGCHPSEYRTPFLRQIRRGLRKILPSRRDRRAAFLLPKYVFTDTFTDARSRSQCLLRFATVIGFVGMLRPHTFNQLQPRSFTLVVLNRNPLMPPRIINGADTGRFGEAVLSPSTMVLGFFVAFKSKTMLDAKAYYPNLSTCSPRFRKMCPTTALSQIIRRGLFRPNFLRSHGKGRVLHSFLKKIVNDDKKVSPHALRIGGRTWYLSMDLEKQFVDYLGTWASSEASARYYRANPAAVIRRLQKFYLRLTDTEAL